MFSWSKQQKQITGSNVNQSVFQQAVSLINMLCSACKIISICLSVVLILICHSRSLMNKNTFQYWYIVYVHVSTCTLASTLAKKKKDTHDSKYLREQIFQKACTLYSIQKIIEKNPSRLQSCLVKSFCLIMQLWQKKKISKIVFYT